MGLFGLLGIAIGLGVGTKEHIKGQKLEMNSIESSKIYNRPYYIDSHGQMRSVKTHNLCHYRTLNNGNVVLVDSTDYTILENVGASRDTKAMIEAKSKGKTVYRTLKNGDDNTCTDIVTGKKMYEVKVEVYEIGRFYFYADAKTHKLIRPTDSEKEINERVLITNPKRHMTQDNYKSIIAKTNKKIDTDPLCVDRRKEYFLMDY